MFSESQLQETFSDQDYVQFWSVESFLIQFLKLDS